MSKKMMLLAAGALTALAFAALPAVASAGEPTVECNGGPCGAFTIHGGTAELAKTNGPSVHCTSVTGTGNYTSMHGGTINLTFHGCKESAFNSHCQSAGQPTQTISTGTLPFTNTYLTDNKTTPGVKIGGTATPHQINVTFTCFGGFVHNRVTGSVVGHLESGCTKHPGDLSVSFERLNPGHQKFTQVTGTGNHTDLISSLNNGAYETASQTGTGTITTAVPPTVTCT